MKSSWKKIRGAVTAPAGYLAAGTACGIKDSKKKDLALIYSKEPASWTAVLTTSAAPAAPVLLTKELLRRRRRLRAVLINSGNANAATGGEGLRAAGAAAAAAAAALGVEGHEVVMASTGIIGRQLPLDRVEGGLAGLTTALSRRGSRAAAEAIMTTDTVPKEEAFELKTGRGTIRIGGMAKGAGMIDPNMATMLAFITTDLALEGSRMKGILREAAEESFNRMTIDGDMSTNDTVLLMANGSSGVEAPRGSRLEKTFAAGLGELCRRLAAKIVLDGEGATKFVEIEVGGARSSKDALRAARAVANSCLVKTALFGEDLNWGRILAALGYSGARLDVSRITIAVNGRTAVRGGVEVAPQEGAAARRQMKKKRLVIVINLGLGKGRELVTTCDLSVDYVKENALYTT